MIGRSRKLTFQLTPLLDLLLIVIFAQYLEVQHQSQRRETEYQQQSHEQLETFRNQRAQEEQRLLDATERLAELQSRHDAFSRKLSERNAELSASLKGALEQQEQIGELIAELFRLPKDLIEEILSKRKYSGTSDKENEELRRRLREMAMKRSHEIIQHLLTVNELRKRADVWDLYITEDGITVFSTGQEKYEFRARNADLFASELFRHYKMLPQPKGLVIIMLSNGGPLEVHLKAARIGLRNAAERMRADTSGRTRFEYADLGYRLRKPGEGKKR